jgi:tight adherence protein B
MSGDMLTYIIAGLAFLVVAALGLALSANDSGKQSKRIKSISAGNGRGRGGDASALAKRKEMSDKFKTLREKEETTRKRRSVGKSVEDKIRQAGLTITPTMFWIGSGVIGLVVGAAVFIAGMEYYVALGAGFTAAFGLPRWLLGVAIGMRQKKFVGQFADAIDVIVRGIKSGQPLGDCLKIIAKESPQPVAGEFTLAIDAIAMGVPMDQALNRMYQRLPLQEVNFFNIVLSIQQKAGGNLSEALGNLSGVLRSRKLLREKIKALSSEAKASAMIIGSLPIIVMLLVYFTTPAYIMTLFTSQLGHLVLLIAGCLMATGIYIMRSMINFKI